MDTLDTDKSRTIALIDDLEDWESEEYEEIPGISNGHEDEDYISSQWLREAIEMMNGELPLLAFHSVSRHKLVKS